MTNHEPRDVSTARHKAAEEVREHVRSQLESWKRVPWLALEAYGHAGYSSRLQFAYLYGLWSVDLPPACHPMRKLFIDCDTGEIIRTDDLRLGSYSSELASDSEVLLLRLHQYAELNSAAVIKGLRTAAAVMRQRHETSPTPESTRLSVWRTNMRESLRLARLFVRTQHHSADQQPSQEVSAEEARMAS